MNMIAATSFLLLLLIHIANATLLTNAKLPGQSSARRNSNQNTDALDFQIGKYELRLAAHLWPNHEARIIQNFMSLHGQDDNFDDQIAYLYTKLASPALIRSLIEFMLANPRYNDPKRIDSASLKVATYAEKNPNDPVNDLFLRLPLSDSTAVSSIMLKLLDSNYTRLLDYGKLMINMVNLDGSLPPPSTDVASTVNDILRGRLFDRVNIDQFQEISGSEASNRVKAALVDRKFLKTPLGSIFLTNYYTILNQQPKPTTADENDYKGDGDEPSGSGSLNEMQQIKNRRMAYLSLKFLAHLWPTNEGRILRSFVMSQHHIGTDFMHQLTILVVRLMSRAQMDELCEFLDLAPEFSRNPDSVSEIFRQYSGAVQLHTPSFRDMFIRTELEDSELMSTQRLFDGLCCQHPSFLRPLFYNFLQNFRVYNNVAILREMNDASRSTFRQMITERKNSGIDIDKLQSLSPEEVGQRIDAMQMNRPIRAGPFSIDADGQSSTKHSLREKHASRKKRRFLAEGLKENVLFKGVRLRLSEELAFAKHFLQFLGHLWPLNEAHILAEYIEQHWLDVDYNDQIALIIFRLMAPSIHAAPLLEFMHDRPELATESVIDRAMDTFNSYNGDGDESESAAQSNFALIARIAYNDKTDLISTTQFAAQFRQLEMFNPRQIYLRILQVTAGDFAAIRLNDQSLAICKRILAERDNRAIVIDELQQMSEQELVQRFASFLPSNPNLQSLADRNHELIRMIQQFNGRLKP